MKRARKISLLGAGMKCVLILLSQIALFLFSSLAHAEVVTFVKEYIYQASEFDSKSSSRILSLEQVKRLLLEEMGTQSETEQRIVKQYNNAVDVLQYWQSRELAQWQEPYLVSETEVKNFQMTKDHITILTAGIVRTKIEDEKWDGKTFYLKAKVSADTEEVTKSLEILRNNRQLIKELEDFKKARLRYVK